MKEIIYICHRPYHILRCCDMINHSNKDNCKNILFTYDVRMESSDEYQRFSTQKIFYSFFDDINELPRTPDPSVRSIFELYGFCQKRRKEYMRYPEKYQAIECIYFFADNELEVQLLVGLFREKSRHKINCVLVDEGLVTYSDIDHTPSWRRRLWLRLFKILAGIKYFNTEQTYGFSDLYNQSLANNPEKAVYFHKPILKLPPLSEETCSKIRASIPSKQVPDYSRPYFIYIGTYEKTFQEDLPIITKLKTILEKYGVNFYIKLHPQQNEKFYLEHFGNDVILEKGVPVELFFGRNAIMAGTISSSLFNASLQGFTAMDISKLFPEEQRLTWVQKPITEQFDWIGVIDIISYEQFEAFIDSFVSSVINDR